MTMKSKRFEALAARPVKKDGFVKEWPEVGLIAMNSSQDPTPSLVVENGVVVELDGKKRADFDMLDTFIANYAIRLEKAQEYMAMDSLKIANMLVDINVPRDIVVDITTSITPAKITEVLGHMTVLEMMMAQSKMRARLMPSNQCHVTNVKDNMVQIAADAVEEATELDLGMRGYTAYAETISVYGTEPVFMDGDDTPYSKAFLASSYASRGLKMRFTSGSGSEVQMGYAEGKSMLYLEARCLYITKGAGVQGTQNGSVSCIGVPAGVPGGIREVLAENLLAACLDLECASSNDQTFTHSDLRRVARSLMQMVPGTDYICSGYSATPNYDNMFAGSNWDADDYDDWNVIQRDLKIDAGLQPVDEDTVVAARAKAARAMQIIFRELGLTEITDAEVEAATYARGSQDMPDRDMVADLKAAEELLARGATAVDFIKALDRGGMRDVADSIFNIQLQKVAGDYLHTASKLSSTWECISAVNYPNTYHGVKTGYVISDERWAQIQDIPWAVDPASI